MPNEENSILFLAAHSGTGEIAYFQNLDKLKPKDIIKLKYKKKHLLLSSKKYLGGEKNRIYSRK